MRICSLSIVPALASVLGCGRPKDRARDSAPTRAVVADAAADSDDLFCRGDTTVRRDDPGKLVREFVVRDGAGEFLSTSTFWESATDCAGEGVEGARVISSYAIDSLGVEGDTARFRVSYHVLGNLMPDTVRGFDPRIEIMVDTFVVVRRPWSWRIVGEHSIPAMLRDAVKAHWKLTPADSTRLDSAARVSAARGA